MIAWLLSIFIATAAAEPARYDKGTGRLTLPVVAVLQDDGGTIFYHGALARIPATDRFVLEEATPLADPGGEDEERPLYEPQLGRLYLPKVITEDGGAYEAELDLVTADPWTLELRYAARAAERQLGTVFREGHECLGSEAQPAEEADVYVSPGGDDADRGTSAQRPWATLARALCALRPGQTLHVLPGTYRESVLLGAFGDDSAPITVRGEADGAGQLPVLEGEERRTMGIALVESRNIVVENLGFQNYSDEGLYVLNGSDLVIRNCRFRNNGRRSINPDFHGEGFGLALAGARRVTVENNEAAGNGPDEERRGAAVLGTGIDTFQLRDSVIRDNEIHGTVGGGILVEDGENVQVESNRIHDNELDASGDYWDGGIWVDGGQNIQVRNNTLVANHGPGITLSDEDLRYPNGSRGYVIEGNTMSGNLFGVYIWNFGVCPPPEDAIRLLQNRIADNTVADQVCSPDFIYVPEKEGL